MIRTLWLWLLWMLLWAGPAAAAVTASLDRTQGTMDDRFVLTVSLQGDAQTRPALPDLEAFDVVPRGTTQRMSMSGGRTTTALDFVYLLVPRQIGRFTIAPITAMVDGQEQASDPLTVEVLAASPQPRADRDAFVTATVSDESPFVGEQVIYTFRFYRRIQFRGSELSFPEFDGFVVQQLEGQREYTTEADGQRFKVVEMRVALFPQQTGPIEIEAATLSIDVVYSSGRGGLFGMLGGYETKTRVLRTAVRRLDVRPLPEAPARFSGLVGDFTLSASLSRDALAAGQSTTLTATVLGTGSVLGIPQPDIAGIEAFKVYDEPAQRSTDASGDHLTGSATFRKSLVPLAAGDIEVGPVTLVWFDPDEEVYRTARQGPFALAVDPPVDGEDLNLTEGLLPGSGKVAVRVVGDDIVPIYRRLDAVGTPPPGRRQRPVRRRDDPAPPGLRRPGAAAPAPAARRRRGGAPPAPSPVRGGARPGRGQGGFRGRRAPGPVAGVAGLHRRQAGAGGGRADAAGGGGVVAIRRDRR